MGEGREEGSPIKLRKDAGADVLALPLRPSLPRTPPRTLARCWPRLALPGCLSSLLSRWASAAGHSGHREEARFSPIEATDSGTRPRLYACFCLPSHLPFAPNILARIGNLFPTDDTKRAIADSAGPGASAQAINLGNPTSYKIIFPSPPQHPLQQSKMPDPVLSQGVGYGVVCGLGIFFSVIMVSLPLNSLGRAALTIRPLLDSISSELPTYKDATRRTKLGTPRSSRAPLGLSSRTSLYFFLTRR